MHNTRAACGLALGLGLVFSGASSANGAILVSDGFDSAGATAGNDLDDAGDVAWIRSGTSSLALTVVSDAGAGQIDSGNALRFSPTGTFQKMLGSFSPTTLGTAGSDTDRIRLSFSVRLTSVPSGAATNSAGLRFGFLNSNSTPVDTNFSNTGNDFGYHVQMGIGASGGATILKEPSNSGGIGGGGSNDTSIQTLISAANINDTSPHSALFEIVRTGSNSLGFSFYFDNVLRSTATNTGTPSSTGAATGIYDTFDEIFIGEGSNTALFLIDNIAVNNVPEPGSFSIAAAGLAALAAGRRRRQPRQTADESPKNKAPVS